MQIKKNIFKKNIVLFTLLFILCVPVNLFNSANCKDIFQFLYQTVSLKDVLSENIFNLYGAQGINYRNIVTTPIGLYYNNIDSLFNNFGINIFYLEMPNGVLFGESNKVSAIIDPKGLVDFYNEKIISLLKNTVYGSINVPFLGEALDYINILQKRLGCIIQGAYQLNNDVFMYLQLPFVYTIYHPNMPSELQGAISMEVAQFNFSPNKIEVNSINKNNSRDLIIKHTVYDTFGLDKSVLGISAKWCDEIINTDLRLLLPGMDIFENNIGGNYENAKNKFSELGLKKLLINLINDESNKINFDEIGSKFLIGFDRLVFSTYYNSFAYQPLGISPSLLIQIPLPKLIFIDFYLSYIYNFSQSRIGCGMKKYKQQLDDTIDFENLSIEDACKDFNILVEILEQKLIPELFEGTFYSGNEYQTSLSLRSTISDTAVAIGLDYWHKEKSFILPLMPNSLIIEQSNKAYQLNSFVNFEYYTYLFCFPISISAFFQATLSSSGIGKEYGGKLQLIMQY